MPINKMEILTTRLPLNRWDKDSIRPGPVGSVGDVNLQVKLKKSTPSMPNRYEKAFSGKNEVWSGSNVSDGQYKGFTSGGRGALTIDQPLPARETFKTNVGWVIENVVPVDRSRVVQTVPLGQYDWESQKARIYKAKAVGEQFLPLPMGYTKPLLTRGSQFPLIVAQSSTVGLPPASVSITDPVFGENGSIEVDVPACSAEEMSKVWVPAMDDPRRKNVASDPFFKQYPYRQAYPDPIAWKDEYPMVGNGVKVYDLRKGRSFPKINTSPCGTIERDPSVPLPTKKERRPAPPKQPAPPKKQKMM